MFDRHQAEISVMQFTGHSLPVLQSMSVPWDFNPVPHCQPSSPTPIEYALPRLWNGMSGGVEGQYTTKLDNLEKHPYSIKETPKIPTFINLISPQMKKSTQSKKNN